MLSRATGFLFSATHCEKKWGIQKRQSTRMNESCPNDKWHSTCLNESWAVCCSMLHYVAARCSVVQCVFQVYLRCMQGVFKVYSRYR